MVFGENCGSGLQEGYPVQAACADTDSQRKDKESVEPALVSLVLSVLVVTGGWWAPEEVRSGTHGPQVLLPCRHLPLHCAG